MNFYDKEENHIDLIALKNMHCWYFCVLFGSSSAPENFI